MIILEVLVLSIFSTGCSSSRNKASVSPATQTDVFAQTGNEKIEDSTSESYYGVWKITKVLGYGPVSAYDRDGVVDWELILNASAFIGEFLLAQCEGSWMWNEDYEAPAIATKDGKVIINVLHRVARYWSKPELPEYHLDNMLKLLQPHPYL